VMEGPFKLTGEPVCMIVIRVLRVVALRALSHFALPGPKESRTVLYP
jgi:hypothetical protein